MRGTLEKEMGLHSGTIDLPFEIHGSQRARLAATQRNLPFHSYAYKHNYNMHALGGWKKVGNIQLYSK